MLLYEGVLGMLKEKMGLYIYKIYDNYLKIDMKFDSLKIC